MKVENTIVLAALLATVKAAMELPKFNQMKLLYPGYVQHGGQYRDPEILQMTGAGELSPGVLEGHNTAAIRMSWVLNRYGGRHAIGTDPVFLSKRGQDSFTGTDGQEYIFRNTAFGPFLAAKYGNPTMSRLEGEDGSQIMQPYLGKQGIVRLVSYRHKHAGGHIGLWDCNQFFQSRDWTMEQHIIAVEFWEAPDSYCVPKEDAPAPQFESLSLNDVQLVSRHNYPVPKHHGRHARSRSQPRLRLHRRRQSDSTFWIQ